MRILLILILFFPLTALAIDALVPEPTPFQVHLFHYPLKKDGEPLYPGQKVGKLIYRDAVELKSESYRFGGFSALNLVKGKLYALSDDGRLVRAKLELKEDKIVSLSEASFDNLWSEEKEPAKKEYDAEGMVHLKSDHFVVGFEQKHRLGFYELGERINLEKTLPARAELNQLVKPNGGIEAVTKLSRDTLFVLTETAKDSEGNAVGYIVDLKKEKWERIALKKTDSFRPTELAILDNEYVALLERSYKPLEGIKVRISLIKRQDITPGAVLETTELARFTHRSDIDNMEGMDVRRNSDGTRDIFLISDDNFNPLQHTILVWLTLPNLWQR